MSDRLEEILTGYKLRDKVLEVYRPLFDPSIDGEYLSHILSQCTLEILAINSDLIKALQSYIDTKVVEAKNEEWRAILGVDFDKFYPVDKYQDFISVPSHWINQQISENNMDVKL